ncbi:hypothetical protein NFJ02_32g81290 [Pycnococcus provasolii]
MLPIILQQNAAVRYWQRRPNKAHATLQAQTRRHKRRHKRSSALSAKRRAAAQASMERRRVEMDAAV